MLTGEDGLPLERPPAGYPVAFPADGILVGDPGPDDAAPAERDLVRRVREVIRIVWGARADAIEAELGKLLGARTLGDWLRRPAGFFADHLARHSKSRRKAPIYWPLAGEGGRYTLWLYYPRLTDQTLYACVSEHVDPKRKEVEADIRRLRAAGSLDRGAQRRLDALEALRCELEGLRVELLAVAELPYRPDRNDGVLITAAPLRGMFRHTPWRRELETCWQALEGGEYDWAHLALAIWPERVRAVCREDRSIAIAHDLEELHAEGAKESAGEAIR